MEDFRNTQSLLSSRILQPFYWIGNDNEAGAMERSSILQHYQLRPVQMRQGKAGGLGNSDPICSLMSRNGLEVQAYLRDAQQCLHL